MKFSFVDADGIVLGVGECQDISKQNINGKTAVEGHPNIPLPNMPASEVSISAGDDLVLSAPEKSVLKVGEDVWVFGVDGSIEVQMQSAGVYDILIRPPFPHENWAGRVVVA